MQRIRELNRKNGEIIRYLIIGVLTTAVSLGVYYGLVLTVLKPEDPVQLQIANIVSWVAAVTFAFFTNRSFVFQSRSPHVMREMVSFFAARLGSLLLDMGIMYVTVSVMGMNDKVMKIVVQVVVTVVNYVVSKYVVFRGKDAR